VPRHLLTAKEIIAARDCDLADGDGLIIRVKTLSITSCTIGIRSSPKGWTGPLRLSVCGF